MSNSFGRSFEGKTSIKSFKFFDATIVYIVVTIVVLFLVSSFNIKSFRIL